MFACGTVSVDEDATPEGRSTAINMAVDDARDSTSGRSGTIRMSADVSDLGLTMDDLDIPIPFDGAAITSSGMESTSRVVDSQDQGCQWQETADQVEATLTIPGLRGQPAAALAVQLTSTTATVTAFGMAVWSCVLRGEIVAPERATVEVLDDADLGLPMLRVVVNKRLGTERWAGFIAKVGEDSIL